LVCAAAGLPLYMSTNESLLGRTNTFFLGASHMGQLSSELVRV
jgi:hypothetical protein